MVALFCNVNYDAVLDKMLIYNDMRLFVQSYLFYFFLSMEESLDLQKIFQATYLYSDLRYSFDIITANWRQRYHQMAQINSTPVFLLKQIRFHLDL